MRTCHLLRQTGDHRVRRRLSTSLLGFCEFLSLKLALLLGLMVDEPQLTWDDYMEDLSSSALGVLPVQLATSNMGQACFVVADFGSSDEAGAVTYGGLKVRASQPSLWKHASVQQCF